MRALLVALGFLLSLPAAPVLADARADFERAKRAIRAGEHDQAVGYYTNIIRSRELGGEALAVVYQNRRAATRARATVTRAARAASSSASAANDPIWTTSSSAADSSVAVQIPSRRKAA